MVFPVSLWRAFLLFFLMVTTLIIADELWASSLSSLDAEVLANGLSGGILVGGLAVFGRNTVLFVMKPAARLPDGWAGGEKAAAILAEFAAKAQRHARLVIFRSDKPSAMTVCDDARCGAVFLSTRMIEGMSESALRGVLAHEVGHLQERHPLRQACLLGVLAFCKGAIGVPALAILFVFLAYLAMSRYWEYIADSRGAALASGADMRAALAEYQSLSGDKDQKWWLEIFSGHPSLHKRLAALA